MQCFDMEAKSWKPLESHAPATEVYSCSCAEVVGSQLFVAGGSTVFHCYDIERNVWKGKETDSYAVTNCRYLCTAGDYIYAITLEYTPQRYCLSKDQWQQYSGNPSFYCYTHKYSGATVYRSKVYVLKGTRSSSNNGWVMDSASLYSFDPVNNKWEEKSSTCQPHFESSLFVVNGKMYVAGGYSSVDRSNQSVGSNKAAVEVYDEELNTWSTVEQKHIPYNNLNAVEIEGRVYFIINKFPFDSGIRIPPSGQVYPVSLDDWKNLANIPNNAVLCHLPMKKGI